MRFILESYILKQLKEKKKKDQKKIDIKQMLYKLYAKQQLERWNSKIQNMIVHYRQPHIDFMDQLLSKLMTEIDSVYENRTSIIRNDYISITQVIMYVKFMSNRYITLRENIINLIANEQNVIILSQLQIMLTKLKEYNKISNLYLVTFETAYKKKEKNLIKIQLLARLYKTRITQEEQKQINEKNQIRCIQRNHLLDLIKKEPKRLFALKLHNEYYRRYMSKQSQETFYRNESIDKEIKKKYWENEYQGWIDLFHLYSMTTI